MALATNTTPGEIHLDGDLHISNPRYPELRPTGTANGIFGIANITVNDKGLITNVTTPSYNDFIAIFGEASNSSLGVVRLAGDLSGNNDATNPQLPVKNASPGSFTYADVTVDLQGRVTSAGSSTAQEVADAIPFATTTNYGLVQIGNTLTVTAGVVDANLATNTTFGIVQPANSNFTIVAGEIDVATTYVFATDETTFSAAVHETTLTIADVTSTFTPDLTQSNVFVINALTGTAKTIEAPTGAVVGDKFYIILKPTTASVIQLTFDPVYKFHSSNDLIVEVNSRTSHPAVLSAIVVSPTDVYCTLQTNFQPYYTHY